MHPVHRPLLLVLVLICSPPLPAEVYRWVDENGATVYSQSPPPTGEQAEVVKPPPPPAIAPEEAQRKLDEQRQFLEDRREDRAITKQKMASKKEEQRRQEQNCQAARNNLKQLEGNTRLRLQDADGQYQRYTEEERQAKMTEARKQIEQYCN